MRKLDWIAVDGGSARWRVWGMAGLHVLHQAQGDQTVRTLAPEDLEPVVMTLVEGWLPEGHTIPLLACGSIATHAGREKAAYRTVPCKPLGGAFINVPSRDPRLSIQVIPGLQQTRPADVTHGEETLIAGFLAQNPGWDGVLCLPGAQSKWVHLSAGEVVSFQTFLTGEMFALLSQHSELRHAVADGDAAWDSAGFTDGLTQGLDRPEWLLARLFSIRAEGLLAGLEPARARARLSGLLIGAEIAGAKPYWLGQRVAVVGESGLGELYAQALRRLSVPVSTHDAAGMALAGLVAARLLRTSLPSEPLA